LGIQIAKALEVAHERGVVHRDVKPQNILLDASGQAKVADFGIARAVGALATTAISQTGLVMGTVNYVSPEQAMSEPVGPQSDLYSLGVVLYEMLTAKVPFEAETLIGVCMKHVNESPHPPKKLNPRVSEGMETIVLKLLAKKTDDRYGSAADLVEDLRRVSNGLAPLTAKLVEVDPRVIQTDMQPTVPIPSGDTARNAMARRRRNRTRASGVLTASFVLLALLGGSDWSLAQNLLRQAFGPSTQSEAPQEQEEEGSQQGTDVETASSTKGTTQAEEATNISSKDTDSSSEQSPSTEIAVSPALASAPVANTSNLSAEPVLWSGPEQQPSQPAPEQQPAKEKPVKAQPAKTQPAEVQAVASQVQSYGGSSNTQDGGRIQKPRFIEQISDSQKLPHK
jgi:serine/threonine-protein kinase